MTDQEVIWTRLGLGTVAALGVLAVGCSADTETTAPATDALIAQTAAGSTDMSSPSAASGEGEGGVTIAKAATDPVVYLSALAIAKAHVLAARDAYAEGETDAAGEMSAHPVSEVLADMQPVFEARGVADFTDLLLDASDAAYAGAPSDAIAKRTEVIVTALRDAEAFAPTDGRSDDAVWAGVVSDQIDRAADMYGVAVGSYQYEPYLDGYGFLKAAEAAFAEHRTAIETSQPRAAAAMSDALSQLQDAYATALRPETLDANPSALKAIASRVQLAVN